MPKKLIMTCAAITALAAFVVAPSAFAAGLTSEGKTVAVGTEIAGASTGEVNFTGSSPVFCSSASLKMKLTESSSARFTGEVRGGELTFSGTGTGGDCTSALGSINMVWNKICIHSEKGTDIVSVTGCGGSVTFTTGITGTGTCKYSISRLEPFLNTTDNDAEINLVEQEVKLEEGGFICPASQKIDISFDLTTLLGGTLTLSTS